MTIDLEAAIDLVHAEIAKHSADEIFAAATAAAIALAERYDRNRVRTNIIAFTNRYQSGADILRALDKRKLDVRECAIDILAELDPVAATRLARAIATATTEARAFKYEYQRAWAFETLARSRAYLALDRLARSPTVERVAAKPPPTTVSESERPATTTPVAQRRRADQTRWSEWLTRYRDGEHVAVWAEIQSTDLSDDATRDQAFAVAREMMKRVRTNLEAIVARLTAGGYSFRHPDRALVAPAADVRATIGRMEELAGEPLPLSVRAFYEEVGSVDFVRAEPDDGDERDPIVAPFVGFEKSDPLVVYPAESAAADIDDWKKRPTNAPRVVLSVEASCKAVPTNGSDSPYRVALRGFAADAAVEGVPGTPSFVEHLRTSLRWGGFAGLAKLEPLMAKSKTIARKKRRTIDEWQLVFATTLNHDLAPF